MTGDRDPFHNFTERFFRETFVDPFMRNVFRGGLGPEIDLCETSQKFIVTADLPGMEKKDIDVSLKEGTLTISGSRKDRNPDESCIVCERSFGHFTRSFSLPLNANTESCDASMNNGVLRIVFDKRSPSASQGLKVEIK